MHKACGIKRLLNDVLGDFAELKTQTKLCQSSRPAALLLSGSAAVGLAKSCAAKPSETTSLERKDEARKRKLGKMAQVHETDVPNE